MSYTTAPTLYAAFFFGKYRKTQFFAFFFHKKMENKNMLRGFRNKRRKKNLFKVIASAPRSSFNENFTSAILDWLLNPHMDHGIGNIFLNRFLENIGVEFVHKP